MLKKAGGHRASSCQKGTVEKACHACGSTTHLRKDCPERGGASGGVPRETETQKDNVAPAPHAEGGGKKRPLPAGGKVKEAPAKTTKVEPGTLSTVSGVRALTVLSLVGRESDTEVIDVSSSSGSSAEDSSGATSYASEMDSSREPVEMEAAVPEAVSVAGTAAVPTAAPTAVPDAVPAAVPAAVPPGEEKQKQR